MIIKLKEKITDYPDLTPDQPYFVIGIEADDYRILNDSGKPYLYPSHLFEVVDPQEPSIWITDYGDDREGRGRLASRPYLASTFVIASVAKQSPKLGDCHVADAPRNDR